MTSNPHTGKFIPSSPRTQPGTKPPTPAQPQFSPASPAQAVTPRTDSLRTASASRQAPLLANKPWTPPNRAAGPAARPVAASPARPPRALASIELFQKAQALLIALPAQPPVLRKEGVELIAALGTGYMNGDAGSLIPALTEARARCGRLLALLTALCPAQLAEFEMQLQGLHQACGYFVRYLQEQQRMPKP